MILATKNESQNPSSMVQHLLNQFKTLHRDGDTLNRVHFLLVRSWTSRFKLPQPCSTSSLFVLSIVIWQLVIVSSGAVSLFVLAILACHAISTALIISKVSTSKAGASVAYRLPYQNFYCQVSDKHNSQSLTICYELLIHTSFFMLKID